MLVDGTGVGESCYELIVEAATGSIICVNSASGIISAEKIVGLSRNSRGFSENVNNRSSRAIGSDEAILEDRGLFDHLAIIVAIINGRALGGFFLLEILVGIPFKIEWDAYQDLKKEEAPKCPAINDRDNDRKVIKWAPIFQDCLARTYGSRGPIIYVLREISAVPTEADDPLSTDDTTGAIDAYYGSSGCFHDELVARLSHTGTIYKHDSASIYMLIEKAARNTSVESTVKAFARKKDGRGAYFAVMANHAGDTKYRAIHKRRMNLLQNIKWSGRAYALETHVSNHRQAVDDISECSNHITVVVPDEPQRVEYLVDSINCSDTTLQATLGLVRANTNNMRTDFEVASSALIEVDPYRRLQKTPQGQQRGGANISSIDFNAGRGSSGVDLRWHHPTEFKALPNDQKEELMKWQKSQDGRKILNKSKEAAIKKCKAELQSAGGGGANKPKGGDKTVSNGAWKKKLKQAVKTQNGFKTIMSVLADEESRNKEVIAALKASVTEPPASASSATAKASAESATLRFPATSLKLSSILNTKKMRKLNPQ